MKTIEGFKASLGFLMMALTFTLFPSCNGTIFSIAKGEILTLKPLCATISNRTTQNIKGREKKLYVEEFENIKSNGGGNRPLYSKPGDIPKFQDALADSKLQAPTSMTIATSTELLAGYTSSYFKVVNDNEIAFYQSGDRKRTELRFEDNYYINNGSRAIHAKMKIISQAGDESTFLQIHDDANVGDGPNKPLLRMYRLKSTNHLYAAIKTDEEGFNTVHIDCGTTPIEYFDCDITLNNSKMTIKINGLTRVDQRDVSFWIYPSYWKAGVYNQDDGGTTIYFNELTW